VEKEAELRRVLSGDRRQGSESPIHHHESKDYYMKTEGVKVPVVDKMRGNDHSMSVGGSHFKSKILMKKRKGFNSSTRKPTKLDEGMEAPKAGLSQDEMKKICNEFNLTRKIVYEIYSEFLSMFLMSVKDESGKQELGKKF
jgi:hypothetical protein